MDVFPFGKPAGAADIVDREDFIRELVQRLSDGHSVILSGPRRTGKSSVAGEVLRRLAAQGAYTAQLDLFHVTNLEELASKLLQSVLANRTGVRSRAARALRGLRQWLSQGELRARVHDLELQVPLGSADVDPLDLLDTAVETAERLAAADGRRMVVLLDEFQEIERLGGEPLLKRLRSLFQMQERTAYLFLGSQAAMMQTIFGDRRRAFFRFALPLSLPPIPDEEWETYIRRRLAEHGIGVTASALAALLARTGGHPYCVMAVAYHAYLHCKLRQLSEINADMVDHAYEQSLAHLEDFYSVQWMEVRRVRHADSVLRAFAEGDQPYALGLHPHSVTKAIQHLLRIGVVSRGQRRGRYALVEPMFGEWVRRHAG